MFALASCEKAVPQHEYSIFAFGTIIDITLYDVDRQQADNAYEQIQQAFNKYHQDWSPWTNGDLAKLNIELGNSAQQGTPVTVPDHLIPLIKQSMRLSISSENNFNPAIGKLINLWQFHKYQDSDIQPPADDRIKALVDKNPKMSDLHFTGGNQLMNTNPALSLNFGAFAKGYAIKLEIDRLRQLNIHNAIINAGGDLSVLGKHGNRAWNIGIRHPRADGIIASVEVKNDESVFTSGDYERFYFYHSKRYHHILDPQTGYPTTGAQSVTVLHQDAALADAAATAIFVAGSRNWQRIAKKMNIQYVMLIDSNDYIHLTPAMKRRIKLHYNLPADHIIVSKDL